MQKVVRTVCYFSKNFDSGVLARIDEISNKLENQNFLVQTSRICVNDIQSDIEQVVDPERYYIGWGRRSFDECSKLTKRFLNSKNIHFNMDLSSEPLEQKHVDFLFNIINKNPSKTFNFAYTFNSPDSSPYFPTSTYARDGFSVGLQPTGLSVNVSSVDEWLELLKETWLEIYDLFENDADFLGIDSSIAPLFDEASFIGFIKKHLRDFPGSVISDVYTKISSFIKTQNPKPVGLCGLMFPCLEDSELALEYERGNFSIERNTFLSLHSGLGIDTYPIGINEDKEDIIDILRLVQSLSNKYSKPLSVRFVSDGKAKTGEMTDFQDQYLKDVIVRKLK